MNIVRSLLGVLLSLMFPFKGTTISESYRPPMDETGQWMAKVKTSTLPPQQNEKVGRVH